MTLTPPPTPSRSSLAGATIGDLEDDPGAGDLRRVLDQLVEDPRVLARRLGDLDPVAVAEHSYWHPNGFAKLVLHTAPRARLRLHVWPAGRDRRGETNPHGHRWHFASTPLCGDGLRSTEYKESPDGSPFLRCRWVGGGPTSTPTPVGNVFLRVCDTHDIRTHDRYAVTTETVHTIDPLGTALVATLVVQGPPRVTTTDVYCAPGARVDAVGSSISPGDADHLVRAVLTALHGSAGRQQ
ncbi:MAG: hypothetical protein AB7V23_10420 [Candidatus Nanopelagicales bacterium]